MSGTDRQLTQAADQCDLATWMAILAFLLRTTDLEPDDIVVRETQ